MPGDDIPSPTLKELAAAMPDVDLKPYDDEQILTWGKQVARSRRNEQALLGWLAAECRRRGHEWNAIASDFQVPRTTIWRWARPFLKAA